jgi:predicted nucleic acid-binding protein
MTENLRLCLDLNIWCAALLADFKGRQDTSCQALVRIVREGTCQLGPVQLIISWGMLNRLRLVLERDLGVTPIGADLYIEAIRSYAILGAAGVSPQLTLGGTGIIALQDREDAHVLETALAGRANLLVTANFRDFRSKDTRILMAERHGIYLAPSHNFHIVHPYLMMEWLKSGQIPPINSVKN